MSYGPYKDLIIAAAQRHGIDPVRLAGLINQESNFDPTAVGDKGRSFGLGQFNVNGALKTYNLTGEQILAMPPKEQIELVADYYKKNLIVAKGDPDKALQLYNGGGDPNYVSKVYRRANKGGVPIPTTELPPVERRNPSKPVTGIDPVFQGNFNAFQQAAKEAGHTITVGSGFRDTARQQQLYAQALIKHGTPAKARKWVAPPGSSSHEHGLAMDLKYSSPAARDWALVNAPKFNLTFRLPNEPWHIEPIGARQQIDAKQSFGNHTIDITQPTGFEQNIATNQIDNQSRYGFSPRMMELLGNPNAMNDENQPIDPNTAALQQLLGAQQAAGQQPNNIMSSIMSNPLIHMGLGIMAGQGNFAQQLSGGLMMGMKNYQDYQAAGQEAQLSQIRLGIQAMNANTEAKSLAERIRQNVIIEEARRGIDPALAPYLQMKQAGLPEDIINQQFLQSKIGLSPEQAAIAATTGKVIVHGEEYKVEDGALVKTTTTPTGARTSEIAPSAEQAVFNQAAAAHGGQKVFAEALNKDKGILETGLRHVPEMDNQIRGIDRIMSKLQAPDVPATGPILGYIKSWYDPFVSEMIQFNIKAALHELPQSGLAPVSNVDVDALRASMANENLTRDQAMTLLLNQKRVIEERKAIALHYRELKNKGLSDPELYSALSQSQPISPTGFPAPAASAYESIPSPAAVAPPAPITPPGIGEVEVPGIGKAVVRPKGSK